MRLSSVVFTTWLMVIVAFMLLRQTFDLEIFFVPVHDRPPCCRCADQHNHSAATIYPAAEVRDRDRLPDLRLHRREPDRGDPHTVMPASSSIPRSPTRRRWTAIFGLVAVMLILPSSCAMDPLLYSSRDASTTGFHQDLAATGDQSRADAELVLEEWATNLNLTAPLVHNIRLRDFKAAGRGLEQFLSVGTESQGPCLPARYDRYRCGDVPER